jgi:uncharacterized protein (UPF0332 family)
MFYVAQAFLLGDGLAFSKHSAVISAFGQHFTKTGRAPADFHRYLRLRSSRSDNYGYGPYRDEASDANTVLRLFETVNNSGSGSLYPSTTY